MKALARARRGLAVAGLMLAASAAQAATHRLDDSLSQVFPPAAEWEWVPFSARGGNTQLQMQVRVNVRIDTRAWVGRTVRVYMVLPPEAAGITAAWETQGRLLGGRLVSGERALVYSGSVPGPWLEDVMRVRLSTDSRNTIASPRLAFHFELDIP